MGLQRFLEAAVDNQGGATAVVDGGTAEAISYETLGRLSDRLRDRLAALGVVQGDRVGVYLGKSADAVAAIFGILKCGAAYIPVDPSAPVSRNAYIHNDCGVQAAIIEQRFLPDYESEISRLGVMPKAIPVDGTGGGRNLTEALDRLDGQSPAPSVPTHDSAPDDLAYVLYTSGSTGRPKGVMVSHQNASSFVRWGSDTFRPGASDVFSAHAPFHFDLSVWDIFAAVRHGARLVVVPDYIGKEPRALAELIARERITMWYSAPSTLSLLAQFGAIHKHDFSSLRMVLFAGEVFPVVHLRSLVRQLPHPRYFNLYGPTETNVCTWFETPRVVPEDRVEPYPIGRTCAHLKSRVVDGDGGPVPAGVEGELCISGTSVMLGYWGRPEMTNDAFLPAEGDLERWYRTGDIVAEDAEGNYRFIGRRDRMIKKRGYRIELGEIESCLYGHPDVRHVAVVALSSDRSETVVKAHIMPGGERRPSLMELKTFCSERLPVYMVPDAVAYHDDLPMTSTGKMDYVALTRLA